jgi:hypothetical protein
VSSDPDVILHFILIWSDFHQKILIVSFSFIDDWFEKVILPVIEDHFLDYLSGLLTTTTDLTQQVKKKLQAIIVKHGGEWSGTLNKNTSLTTVLISTGFHSRAKVFESLKNQFAISIDLINDHILNSWNLSLRLKGIRTFFN